MRARGLRPRGTRPRLAIAAYPIVPSAHPKSVGVPECESFAAEYPARTFLCQRFDVVLANNSA